uniref:Uncharacterized protein n=1 Tax=Kalanchoe fedtschenkoi TaxID=63787 RepID=A0A7N0TKD8_KALFE
MTKFEGLCHRPASLQMKLLQYIMSFLFCGEYYGLLGFLRLLNCSFARACSVWLRPEKSRILLQGMNCGKSSSVQGTYNLREREE